MAEPGPAPPRWLPTHVQVAVLQARGLRSKAGAGPVYAVLQLGREKYSTCAAEGGAGRARWAAEECAFELEPPDWGDGGELVLTVLHRALLGMDKFLGRATLPLGPALQAGRAPRDQWYKLHSKAGKKEKERGEIQVTIQFTRNNMTASMFDLSMKDKPRSPFGKLKDKMKGKKKYDLESASAIIPSSTGALDVEDYDFGGKKSKTKGFFLKNKLRKSSLTQSNTSLGSDSTISSASSSLANNFGISINAPEVTKSPSRHSSLSTERSVKDYLPSPKLTHKRAFSDEVSQVSTVPESKSIQSLKPKNEPVSRSSLCINGSHIYSDEPTPKSPMSAQQSSLPLSVPLQNVAKRPEEGFSPIPFPPDSQEPSWRGSSFEKTQPKEEPRFIPSPPSLVLQEELKVSTKAVTLSNHLGRARMEEGGRIETKPVQIATPMVFSGEPAKEEGRKEDKKTRGGLFHHRGKADAGEKSLGEKQGTTQASQVMAGEEKSKTSWFSSKDTKEPSQKPSPHPVKPISAAVSEVSSEKKQHRSSLTSALSSGLEKLKTVTTGSIQPVAPSTQLEKAEHKKLKDPALPDQSAKYYHLTHDELIQLLLQREKELSKKEEHIQELENYIDRLLVRIMEQSPTLLQIPLEETKTSK